MRYLLLLFTLLCSFDFVIAQQSDTLAKDLIILNNNIKLKGKIIELNKKQIVFLSNGSKFVLKRKNVEHIYFSGDEVTLIGQNDGLNASPDTTPGFELIPVKQFEKKGFYNITYGNLNFPNENFGIEGGLGIENVSGYQFNKFTGVGIGLGSHKIDYRNGHIAPVYAQYRGYVTKKRVSPYYNLDVGFAFPIKSNNASFNSSKPGSYLYPAIGYKIGSDESAFMIDVGIRYANYSLLYENESSTIEDSFFNRLTVLRLGIML